MNPLRTEGAEEAILGSLPRLRSARLAARAASICSGVRTSGSDSLMCCFARSTWRLCRFANRLSILLHYTLNRAAVKQTYRITLLQKAGKVDRNGMQFRGRRGSARQTKPGVTEGYR